MAIEDVTLDDLQVKLDHSSIPLAVRVLPIFFLGLSAFDALGLIAGRPGVGVLFLPRALDEVGFGSLLFLEGVVHAMLLGGAIFLRYKSSLAGVVRLDAREQLLELPVLHRLVARFGAQDEDEVTIASRRRMFLAITLALLLVGAILIPGPETKLWLVPATTAAWVVVAVGVAWFLVVGFSAGGGTGMLGVAAAGALSVLFIAAGRSFEPSPQSIIVALTAFAAMAASLAYILTSDPSRDRILRLQTTAGAGRGLYKCEPHLESGPVFLQLQLDESSPLLLFEAEQGSNAFRPVSVDARTDSIALHSKRVRIWNLRRLKQLVPSEIELRDHNDYMVANARVTQLLGSTALDAAGDFSDEVLMIAARRILDEGFADTLQTELVSAFHDFAETLAPELAELQARLAMAEIKLAGLDQVQSASSDGVGPVAKLHAEWKELTTAVNATLAKLKGGRSEALQLNEAWKRMIGDRLREGRGADRGLSGDEAQQILALLMLKVVIVRTELGSAAVALKQQLSDLPKAMVGRFDEQRGWRKDLILKLLGDPVTAAQFADVLGKNPELLGGAPLQGTDTCPGDAKDSDLLGPEPSRSGTPRNRN